nr:MarR family transcriptional regulator [Microbacterium bovistercoris]
MDEPASALPLSRAIFRVARAHKSLAARLLRGAGLRPGQELVLMTLWEDGPQRQVDLVEALESDAGTMTRSIARLEKVGLVRRRPSPTDGRAVIVEVTDAGLALRAQVDQAWTELERVTRGELSDDRVARMIDDLADLERNVAAASASRRDSSTPLRTAR